MSVTVCWGLPVFLVKQQALVGGGVLGTPTQHPSTDSLGSTRENLSLCPGGDPGALAATAAGPHHPAGWAMSQGTWNP